MEYIVTVDEIDCRMPGGLGPAGANYTGENITAFN